MKILFPEIKSWARKKVWQIVLFSYALGLGTSLSLVLSRCNSNCLNCGSCGLYLGIIPVIAAVALRNQIKRGWDRILHNFSREAKTASRNGHD
jgi:hypothetical protein